MKAQYIIDAIDEEGEVILSDMTLTAATDRQAWADAVELVFFHAKQGQTPGIPMTIMVRRIR